MPAYPHFFAQLPQGKQHFFPYLLQQNRECIGKECVAQWLFYGVSAIRLVL